MIKKILEKTGLIDIIFYFIAVAFWLLFWILFNVVCRNYRRRDLYYIRSIKDLKLYMSGKDIQKNMIDD